MPSVLEKNWQLLEAQIKRLSPFFNFFQIDIADGILVDNKTVQIEEIRPSVSNLSFDFHLMVRDYETEVKKVSSLTKIIKIKNIFIHFSVLPNFEILNTRYPDFKFGLVLDTEDRVKTVARKYDLKKIPIIQIMSVNSGRQGNTFIPETLKKIEQLRLLDYGYKIFLDGGINQQTIPFIISQKYLPDYICPGSFLTKSPDLKKSIQYLNDIKLKTIIT